MRLHHAILPVAIILVALRCTGSGFSGGGKAEKEEDAGEDKKGDKPVDVAGSFLVCGAEAQAENAKAEDTYGCAAVDSTTKKRLGSATFKKIEVVVDGKRRKAAPVKAPDGSFWHTLFKVRAGATIESVNATGDFATSGAPSATVDYRKPALGQQVDGEIPLEAPPAPTPTEPAPAAHMVFVTSERFNGNFGGLSGADAECNKAAARARLVSKYEALLGAPGRMPVTILGGKLDMTNWAGDRLSANPGPIAAGLPLAFPVALNEFGGEVRNDARVWTGFQWNGGPAPNCDNWSSTNHEADGVVGYAWGTEPRDWLGAEEKDCAGSAHLYCVSMSPEPYEFDLR